MERSVKLNELESVLSTIQYPVAQDTAIVEFADVTLVLAEGTEPMSEILRASSVDQFDSMDDLSAELMNLLPQHAVGEPYQSEGDA